MVYSDRTVVGLLPKHFRSGLTIFCNCICVFLTFCWPCVSVINQLDGTKFLFYNKFITCVYVYYVRLCFEHMCSKHVDAWNELIVKQKFCASSWLITEITVSALSGVVRMLQWVNLTYAVVLSVCSPFSIRLTSYFSSVQIVFHQFFTYIVPNCADLLDPLIFVPKAGGGEGVNTWSTCFYHHHNNTYTWLMA